MNNVIDFQKPAASKTNKKLERLAWLLDNSFRIPGTSMRMGLDGILGLIPGLGDITGSALSTYILLQALNAGVAPVVIARMGINILFDTFIGMIPIVGDIFDITFKANLRNLELINAYHQSPQESVKRSALSVAAIFIIFIAILIFMIWLAINLFQWVISL